MLEAYRLQRYKIFPTRQNIFLLLARKDYDLNKKSYKPNPFNRFSFSQKFRHDDVVGHL